MDMTTIDKAAAAKTAAAELLGVPEREVVSVQDAKAGTVIQTFDGNAYINVTGTDGAAQTGLMFLVPPHPKYDPRNGIPVYSRDSSPAVPSELNAAQAWRAQQLAVAADGLDVALDTTVHGETDPLADASVEALVDDPGPQPDDGHPVNENPADQKPDEAGNPQPADEVVAHAKRVAKKS